MRFKRIEKISILLITLMIIWIFLIAQYTEYIVNSIGIISVAVIFLILISSLMICGEIYRKKTREEIIQIYEKKDLMDKKIDEQSNEPIEPH